MAVTFTTNIGLAKPDKTELASNWIQGAQLYDDNNVIIKDKMEVDTITYTPTIIGFSSAPNTGVGSKVGEYQDFQGFIDGSIVINFTDPGVTIGGGEFGFSLPLVADSSFHTVGSALNLAPGANSCIGEGYLYDASAVTTSGTCALDLVTITGVSYARIITETFTGKVNRMFRDNMPFGFANGDKLTLRFKYKKI